MRPVMDAVGAAQQIGSGTRAQEPLESPELVEIELSEDPVAVEDLALGVDLAPRRQTRGSSAHLDRPRQRLASRRVPRRGDPVVSLSDDPARHRPARKPRAEQYHLREPADPRRPPEGLPIRPEQPGVHQQQGLLRVAAALGIVHRDHGLQPGLELPQLRRRPRTDVRRRAVAAWATPASLPRCGHAATERPATDPRPRPAQRLWTTTGRQPTVDTTRPLRAGRGAPASSRRTPPR